MSRPLSAGVISSACARRTDCRVCRGRGLEPFLDLGSTALANSFLRPEELGSSEPFYPLDVSFCPDCGQVQLGVVVPPEIMFRHYLYVSGTSETIPRHFSRLAQEARARFMAPGALAVEIASNDGTLLKAFHGSNVRCLGVEPAVNLARTAGAAGIPTVNEFFSEALAKRLRSEHGAAAVVIANNVLAHINDLDDFCRGVSALLDRHGTLIVEVPHLLDLVEKREFDTVYHEHLSYFSAATLSRLFARFGLTLFDARRVGVHGGSLRLYVRGGPARRSAALSRIEDAERRSGLGRLQTYQKLAERVQAIKRELPALLGRLKSQGKRLAGYGAPAKGNTLLQYCGIGTETLDFLVDRNPLKQGLRAPGSHIPVSPVDRLLQDRPDYALLLAWNFQEEILRQQDGYLKAGGRFILPVPRPRIL